MEAISSGKFDHHIEVILIVTVTYQNVREFWLTYVANHNILFTFLFKYFLALTAQLVNKCLTQHDVRKEAAKFHFSP